MTVTFRAKKRLFYGRDDRRLIAGTDSGARCLLAGKGRPPPLQANYQHNEVGDVPEA